MYSICFTVQHAIHVQPLKRTVAYNAFCCPFHLPRLKQAEAQEKKKKLSTCFPYSHAVTIEPRHPGRKFTAIPSTLVMPSPHISVGCSCLVESFYMGGSKAQQ